MNLHVQYNMNEGIIAYREHYIFFSYMHKVGNVEERKTSGGDHVG